MATIKFAAVRNAVSNVFTTKDASDTATAGLQAALTAECGKAGTKAADAQFAVVRSTICDGMTKRNETLKAAAGKLFADCDQNEQLCRIHLLLSVTWSHLKPGGRKSKKGAKKSGKATVTKVTGVAKAQVRVIATKPKRLSDTLKVILATIQASEKPAYKDVPRLVAALQLAIDLAV